MCGIVGFTGSADKSYLIEKMNNAQFHRGPDDSGHFYCSKNNIHLGMRRLSIIDIDRGDQPMKNPSNETCIIYNGEIFNSPELRINLEKKGYKFKSHNSDTEVILKMYEEYGIKMLKKLNGMFAFSLYDEKNKKIFCARDTFGIKPFFYNIVDGIFSFSSEIKSIVELPWISKVLENNSIFNFFSFQFIPGNHTVYKGIYKIMPGHYLEWNIENKSHKIEKYSSIDLNKNIDLDQNDLDKFVIENLKNAVKRWTLSDVPVACSLSGGIDSSAILAIMASQSKNSIKTFTLGFEDSPEIDERSLANIISKTYNTEHTEIIIRSDDLLSEIDKMLFALDEPYAGGLPSWFVYKEMSKSVKVGLTGTGADELFGNYGKWYPYARSKEFLKHSIKYFIRKKGGFKEFINSNEGCLYNPLLFSHFYKFKDLFSKDFLSNVYANSEKLIANEFDRNYDKIENITLIDLKYQLPEEFLFMTDRFSMAHSIEIRTPFLDQEFSENILRINHNDRFSHNKLKFLLKNSIKDIVPKEILNSSKKGFILPMEKWLKGSLKNDLILFSEKDFLSKQNIFQIDIRDKLIAPFINNKTSNSDQVWVWWMFQKWWSIHNLHTAV